MIPPAPKSLFEDKTVFGTGCDDCKRLQVENGRLKNKIIRTRLDLMSCRTQVKALKDKLKERKNDRSGKRI